MRQFLRRDASKHTLLQTAGDVVQPHRHELSHTLKFLKQHGMLDGDFDLLTRLRGISDWVNCGGLSNEKDFRCTSDDIEKERMDESRGGIGDCLGGQDRI